MSDPKTDIPEDQVTGEASKRRRKGDGVDPDLGPIQHELVKHRKQEPECT